MTDYLEFHAYGPGGHSSSSMSKFKRERRYHVAKIKDVKSALTPSEIELWKSLHLKVTAHRISHGKPPLECAVVESDWPEYETTWKAIQERVESSSDSAR